MLDSILVQDSAKSPSFTQFFGVDAKYAKHLSVVGEMHLVADTDNKVGRTKIDPRGKIYRLLNPKTSRDVKWIGRLWAEFYKIKMIDRASGYVDPDEDIPLGQDEDHDEQEEEIEPEEDKQEVIQVGQSQAEEPTETPVGVASDEPVASRTRIQTTAIEPVEEEEDQDVEEEELEPEEDESDVIQVGQSQEEEPTETPVGVASDGPVASRTRSQTSASEPIAARTRQALWSCPEMSAFVDVKDDKTINEWLHEIALHQAQCQILMNHKVSKKLGGILI